MRLAKSVRDELGFKANSHWIVMRYLLKSGPKSVTAFSPDNHLYCLHLTSNQQQLENQTDYVVINAIVVSS